MDFGWSDVGYIVGFLIAEIALAVGVYHALSEHLEGKLAIVVPCLLITLLAAGYYAYGLSAAGSGIVVAQGGGAIPQGVTLPPDVQSAVQPAKEMGIGVQELGRDLMIATVIFSLLWVSILLFL